MAKLIKYINRVVYACDIGIKAEIPMTVTFMHSGLGVVIGDGVKIGENCKIYSNVVIGSRERKDGSWANPVVGKNVVIGAGAILLGDITIGDDAVIAAGSVVLESVPPSAMVAGNPAVRKK